MDSRTNMLMKLLRIGIFTMAVLPFYALAQAEEPKCQWGTLEAGIPGFEKKCIDDVVGFGGRGTKNSGLVGVIAVIINIVTGVVIGVGLIAVVVGGYIYMTAGGSAQRVGTAKTVIGAALLGIVLAIAAQLILNTISPQFAEQIKEPVLKLEPESQPQKSRREILIQEQRNLLRRGRLNPEEQKRLGDIQEELAKIELGIQ